MADRRRLAFWAAAVLLVGVTLIAYLPALGGGFVWDDDSFLTGNKFVKAADGLYRFWFTTDPTDYWPVTSSVLWFEWRLWGMNPLGYHAVNLGLHLAEVFLLRAVLRRLRFPAPYLAAFLFAVHPVNVESVAWIAQLKNLMAMLFYLLAILFFLRSESDQQGSGPAKRDRSHRPGDIAEEVAQASPPAVSTTAGGTPALLVSLICFILAMLSKGSVAILPLVLAGIVLWRRPLNRGDCLRLAPFFAASAILVMVDMWFQKHGLRVEFRHAGFLERLLGAGAVVWFYLGKALLPIGLIFVYPAWQVQAGDLRWWVPLAAAAGLTAVLFHYRARGTRPALFAWGYFCAALVPVMGFTDVYFMKYSLVADHYQHLALIGVVGFVAAGWARWDRKAGRRELKGGWRKAEGGSGILPRLLAGAVIVALAGLTWRQGENYRDAETLYDSILERNPAAWLAENNLANVMFRSGRYREAIPHYLTALRLKPDLAEAHNNLGLALVKTGRIPEAVAHFGQAIRFGPDYSDPYNNLGVALADAHRPAEAIPYYRKALQISPDFAAARYNLGNALAALGQMPEAIESFRAALRLRPGYAEAHTNLGAALAQTGDLPAAITELEEAVRLDPSYVAAHEILGQVLCGIGRIPEGQAQLELAARLAARRTER